MLLRPNNGGMAEGMACNGVMAREMAEWSNGGINGSHNIIPLVNNDGTPYGWAFENFYNAKDFVKDLSNRNNALIFFGGLEFKSFSN